MKNSLSKWGFALAALSAGFIITCAMSGAFVYASDSDQQQSDDTAYSDEVQLLQMKADLMAEEVNDMTKEEIKKAETLKRNRYLEEFHTEPEEVNLFTNEEFAAFEQQRQEKLKVVQVQLENQVKDLQQNVSAEGQQAGKSQPAQVMPKPRPPKGTVGGIVIYQKKGAALVDGRILRENSTVRDIKVLQITKDYVEFEKQGRKWKQAVGQWPPAEFWTEPAAEKKPAPAQQSAPAGKLASGQKTPTKK